MDTAAHRNFACPDYDTCLNQAVQGKRRGFHCDGCPRQHAVREDWRDIQEQDMQRVVTLFEAVCRRQSRTSSKPLTPEDLAFLWEEETPGQEACV